MAGPAHYALTHSFCHGFCLLCKKLPMLSMRTAGMLPKTEREGFRDVIQDPS